jgi:hypothetical protein
MKKREMAVHDRMLLAVAASEKGFVIPFGGWPVVAPAHKETRS